MTCLNSCSKSVNFLNDISMLMFNAHYIRQVFELIWCVSFQSGLILSESEWQEEWNGVLRQSSTKPRSTPGNNQSCCDSAATKGSVQALFLYPVYKR